MLVLFALEALAAVFAFFAGCFWYASTRPKPKEEELVLRHDGGKQSNAERTRVAEVVANRNATAALFAAASSVLVAISIAIQSKDFLP